MRRDRLRIALDARPLSHPHAGGFKSYVRGLVRGLTERAAGGADHVELLLFVDRPFPDDVRGALPPNTSVCVLSQDRIRTDLLGFRRALRRTPADVLHGTQNYVPPVGTGTPTTVTIHDAFGVRRWPWEEAGIRRTPRERFIHGYWKAMTRYSARTARRVVTISRASAADISETLHVPPGHISVVYNCASMPDLVAQGSPPIREANSILAIASPDPRKDMDTLYAALALLERGNTGARLSLACGSEVLAARAKAAVERHGAHNVRYLVGLDDDALARAYANAACFAFPSWREGFGAPPLEAMAAGCPVASSEAPALPEILGDAALFFPPGVPDACADALRRLLADDGLRADLGERGRLQAARYSPRRMADETVAVWHATTRSGSP